MVNGHISAEEADRRVRQSEAARLWDLFSVRRPLTRDVQITIDARLARDPAFAQAMQEELKEETKE